jgi:ribosomal protein S30
MNLRTIIARRKKALKHSSPRTRDRLRHQFRVAQVAQQIRKECA